MKKIFRLLFILILFTGVLIGCDGGGNNQEANQSGNQSANNGGESSPTDPPVVKEPEPTEPPAVVVDPALIPGWEKFEARGIEIQLPESFEGGDPSEDLDFLVEKIRMAEQLRSGS